MSDNEIRQILIEQKKRERAMQRKANIRTAFDSLAGWASLTVLGYIMFLGAYMAR